MGGIGKTTIMKNINNELLKEKIFDQIIWVTVSKELNIAKLQDDIARALDEELPEKDEISIRAGKLLEMLTKRKFLIILDDVWKKISLEEVGIPEPTESNGCKLILTTRSHDVCRSMGCEVIKVEPLSTGEALNLFLNKVGDVVSRVPTLEPIVKLVVKQCAGLPLAIVTIASSMKNVDDIHVWRSTLKKLKKWEKSIMEEEDKVFEQLKFSYDRLGDGKVQNCFLHCTLYPEDFEIPKDELVGYWILEGFVEEMDSMQAEYDMGYTILHKLESNCLLMSGMYADYVKMHDLVRDMALRITGSRFMIKAGVNLEEAPKEQEWTEDLEKVSLMKNFISTIAIAPERCPKLSTLLLQGNYRLKNISESFFVHMSGLTILDLSSTSIKSLPNSISNLKNLAALLLRECFYLEHLPSLSDLQALKKLDLSWTRIRKLPQGMEMLVNLRYLDLGIYVLEEVTVGLLPKLSHLQYLSLSLISSSKISAIKAEEVSGLRKLETFEAQFYNLQEFNKYIKSLQGRKELNNYFLAVGNWVSETLYSKAVGLSECSVCGDLVVLPSDVQQLCLQNCNDIKSLSDISLLKGATQLNCYAIGHCKELDCLFSLAPPQGLERLILLGLPKLHELFGQPATPTMPPIFIHLREISLIGCRKIKKLFPPWLVSQLQILEEIYVSDCDQMEEIMASTSDDEEGKEAGDRHAIKLAFPKLKKLVLKDLSELKHICSSRRVMLCDSLQIIEVRSCPKLMRIPVSLPLLDDGQPSPPPSLVSIEVSPEQLWESLEWDHPNAKNVLQPYFRLR